MKLFCLLKAWRLIQLALYLMTQSWKGKYSTRDPESWKNSVLAAEIGYNVELAAKHDDGVFWISWDDVLQVGHVSCCLHFVCCNWY